MTQEKTQFQDDDQQRQSRELSRQRSHPPTEVPGYEPRQFLGAGAYGEVWVAVDENTGRKVAIKFYTHRSGVDWSLLSREVEKLVFLSADRYVVQLLDVGWDAQPPYYVMEYVSGGSLQQLLDNEGNLPVGEAVEMFREIATGLLHAHGKGVLHCDLKPDNILLDQDRKPRLADFGQSRLSHEQTPALGTLFYMAPEQADLDALPDARWDVYALGALLYTMLTGAAPYRSEAIIEEIDSDSTLVGRLETYRERIRSAPIPAEHRQIPGVDRDLADIVDRCLSENPDSRFPNVQSVLTAIRNRDQTKDRRPLLLLGLIGPLLFLLVLALFGGSAYNRSVANSGEMIRDWTSQSSHFAAKFVAAAVARDIEHYFRLVGRQAEDDALQQTVLDLNKELRDVLTGLVNDQLTEDEKRQLREQFRKHRLQNRLQERTAHLIENTHDNVASWFITDARGLQLASSFRSEENESTVGRDFSYRTYFHGGNEDLTPQSRHQDVPPITAIHLSTVFQSRATNTWKVAVSSPIVANGETVGVIALTLELGRLVNPTEFAATDARFATLVDGRQGADQGRILQHPLFDKLLSEKKVDELGDLSRKAFHENIYDIPVSHQKPIASYEDPIGKTETGKAYKKDWVAAREHVSIHPEDGPENTDLIVVVQEDYDKAAEAVESLGNGVKRDALVAFLIILSGVLYLWYLVTRAIRDPNEALRRSGGITVRPSSLHSMETVEMPRRMRDS